MTYVVLDMQIGRLLRTVRITAELILVNAVLKLLRKLCILQVHQCCQRKNSTSTSKFFNSQTITDRVLVRPYFFPCLLIITKITITKMNAKIATAKLRLGGGSESGSGVGEYEG